MPTICVKTLTFNKYEFDMEECDTFLLLKYKVQEKVGIHADQIHFIIKGKKCNDMDTFHSISSGTVIHMVIQLLG